MKYKKGHRKQCIFQRKLPQTKVRSLEQVDLDDEDQQNPIVNVSLVAQM